MNYQDLSNILRAFSRQDFNTVLGCRNGTSIHLADLEKIYAAQRSRTNPLNFKHNKELEKMAYQATTAVDQAYTRLKESVQAPAQAQVSAQAQQDNSPSRATRAALETRIEEILASFKLGDWYSVLGIPSDEDMLALTFKKVSEFFSARHAFFSSYTGKGYVDDSTLKQALEQVEAAYKNLVVPAYYHRRFDQIVSAQITERKRKLDLDLENTKARKRSALSKLHSVASETEKLKKNKKELLIEMDQLKRDLEKNEQLLKQQEVEMVKWTKEEKQLGVQVNQLEAQQGSPEIFAERRELRIHCASQKQE